MERRRKDQSDLRRSAAVGKNIKKVKAGSAVASINPSTGTAISVRSELRGGLEAALQGLPAALVPILLFLSLFGPAQGAGAWAALMAATAVASVTLLMQGNVAMLFGSRAASLSVYVAMILQIGHAVQDPAATGAGMALTLHQFTTGLATASLLYLGSAGVILLVGVLRLGNVFKMIPAPVTAGIANGTALSFVWLAAQQWMGGGAASVMTGLATALCFLLWPRLQQWSSARGNRLAAAVPAIVIALALGLALALAFEPAFQAKAPGSQPGWTWMSVTLWPQLADQPLSRLLMIGLPGALTLALVMILETFTTASLMETRCGIRVNPNREILILGVANALSAVLGGVPASMHPARSLANWIGGGRGRLAAIATLALTGGMLFFAGDWLVVLPAGIVAGLFLIQASLLADRVSLARFGTMLRKQQWLVDGRLDVGLWMALLIALVAFFGSLIWACSLGVALSSLVVLRRVSSNLVANWGYLDHHTSRRVRSRSEQANLQRMAHRVGVLRLTGHLFFGNSARLSQLVEELHADARAVVVDIGQVSDVDPSGVAAMQWVLRTLRERDLTVVLTGLQKTRSTELRAVLSRIAGVEYRIDLDRGLELCEEMLLQNATVIASPLTTTPLEKNVLLQDLSADEITTVLMLGERRQVAKGAPLFRRDALADGIWLLEEGIVSILANDSDSAARLSTFGPGQFVGEMGFIDGKTRSATALADSPVTAFLLDTSAIDALVNQQPGTALKITRNIARELSYRVRSTSALMAESSNDAQSEWPHSTTAAMSRL